MGENAFRRPCNFKELHVVKKAHITTCALCACRHLCTASAEQIFPRDSVQRNCFELALYTARDRDCISNRIGSGIRSAMQMSSRYVRCAPNAVDDRTDHHADRSSTSGPSSSGKTLPSFHPFGVAWDAGYGIDIVELSSNADHKRRARADGCAVVVTRNQRIDHHFGNWHVYAGLPL